SAYSTTLCPAFRCLWSTITSALALYPASVSSCTIGLSSSLIFSANSFSILRATPGCDAGPTCVTTERMCISESLYLSVCTFTSSMIFSVKSEPSYDIRIFLPIFCTSFFLVKFQIHITLFIVCHSFHWFINVFLLFVGIYNFLLYKYIQYIKIL